MKVKKFSLAKALDINCWRIKFKNENYRKIVSTHLSALPSYQNKVFDFDFSPVREELFTSLLSYSKKNCPYYHRQLSGINTNDIAELHRIPLLTKDIIRTNLSDLVSKRVSHKSMRFTKTGGSTGNPLGFWISGGSDDLHQEFLFKSMGYKEGDKILAMDGTMIEKELMEKQIYWKTKNNGNELPYGGMGLSALALTETRKKYYLDFLTQYRPDFIRGYPFFIAEMANYILETGRRIEFDIKGIQLTSEVIFDYQISAIKNAFNSEVFGQYGHHESSVISYTIDEGFEYYCSPLYGYTEVLDQHGNHVNINEEGEVVVTGFANFGMPFIRYKTGDRATYGGEKQGIVKLSKILGRIFDYVINKKGDKVVIGPRNFAKDALFYISQWQILQLTPGEIVINISRLPGYNEQHELLISKNFKKLADVTCTFEYDKEFQKTKAGKTLFVVQNTNTADLAQ